MKKLIGLIIGISLYLNSYLSIAQTHELSDSVLAKVIDELIVKDHLQFTVNELDSTLTIYKHTVDAQKEEIRILKLNAKDYQSAIALLEKEVQLQKDNVRDLRRENIKGRITSFLKGLATGVIIIVSYLVVTSNK